MFTDQICYLKNDKKHDLLCRNKKNIPGYMHTYIVLLKTVSRLFMFARRFCCLTIIRLNQNLIGNTKKFYIILIKCNAFTSWSALAAFLLAILFGL